MPERSVIIVNKLGLHARAASKFVNLASRYHCEIEIERDSRRVNGKSIMGVMMLAASKGTTVTIYADGEDAEEGLDALEALVKEGFGED